MKEKDKAVKIIEILENRYGRPKPALNYTTPFELLIATILSAQCTDKRVNIVTEELFKECNTPAGFIEVSQDRLEELIKSTGFYKNKAKNIKGCCETLLKNFAGNVPDTMENLISLPGVGRKTANVILGHIFGKQGIVVDTHVKRISKKIGFTENDDPTKIEFDLMKVIPDNSWTLYSDVIILHGRETCKAIKPRCNGCIIREYCKYGREVK